MTHFIKDNTALNAAKVDFAIRPGVPDDKKLRAADWNQHRSALLDLQSFVRGADWLGVATNLADPAPSGVANYLWVNSVGDVRINVGGVDRPVGGNNDTRDIFHVTDHGADVTGALDATAAVQSAINAAVSNVTSTGRVSVIAFPAGTFLFNLKVASRQFDISGKTKLVFQGVPGRTVLKMTGDAGAGDWYLFHIRNGSSDIEFRDLIMDQDGLTNPDIAEQNHLMFIGNGTTGGSRDIRIYDCVFKNAIGDGIRQAGEFGAFVDDVDIIRCRFEDCGRAGVSVQRFVRGMRLLGCTFHGGTDQQLDFEPTGFTFQATTGGSSTVLIRTGSLFITWGIKAGDPIFSEANDWLGFVTSVDSETQLTTSPLPTGTWDSLFFSFPRHCSGHLITNNIFTREPPSDPDTNIVTLTSMFESVFSHNRISGSIQAIDVMRSRIAHNVIVMPRQTTAELIAIALLKSTLETDIEFNTIFLNATATNILRYGIRISGQVGRFPHSCTIRGNLIHSETYCGGIGVEGIRRALIIGNRLVLNTPGVTNQSRAIYCETVAGVTTERVVMESNEISAIAGAWVFGLEFNSKTNGISITNCSARGGSVSGVTSGGVAFRASGTGGYTNPPIYDGVINQATTELVLPPAPWVVIGGNSVGARIFRGTGSPEGVLAAPVGSIAVRTDGSGGAVEFIKNSGTGNTGWVPVGGVVATGSITCVAKANYVDADFMTISDGIQAPKVYEFDAAGDGVTAGRVQVNISGATTAADVAAILKTAIDTNQPSIAVTDAGGGVLNLAHRIAGTFANVAITESVADVGHLVTGMSGGINPAR